MASRDYQHYAAQSVWTYFEKNSGNPLILMPTGTGKSHVIADLARSILHHFPRQRIICLTHVKELIQQNYNKLIAAWPNAPAGIYSAGLGRKDIHNNLIFAGIQSVAKMAHAFGHVDLIFIDEAHTVSPSEKTLYQKFISALKQTNPMIKVIGLTATGFRLGHGKIYGSEEDIFTDVCVDMTGIDAFNWFISQGYLLPLVPKKTKLELDVSGVHLRGGEYIQAELQNAVDKADITRRALEEAIACGQDRRKWLIFASGVEHAVHIAEQLDLMGFPCGVVHSKMADEERDRMLADHRAGKYRAIANNNILTTGYDDPEIDLILILRPTASPVLWVQMLGRGTRPFFAPGFDLDTLEGRMQAIAASPKKDCLVLDFAGNTRRLGPINDPVLPRKKGEKAGTAPVKLCEACQTYNHASARVCMHCGAPFTFQTKLKQAASTEELIKGELPVVTTFKVDSITLQAHNRVDKPSTLRVSYFCGLRKFDEYVCLEHPPGFAQRKAYKWWEKRSNSAPPTVEGALSQVSSLRNPTHLRVWVNRQYPEIMDYDFTGTAFGTENEMPDTTWPEARSYKSSGIGTEKLSLEKISDDDIPF